MEELRYDTVTEFMDDFEDKLGRIKNLLHDESLLCGHSPNSTTNENIKNQLIYTDTLLALCTVESRSSFLASWEKGRVSVPSLRKCFRGKLESTTKGRETVHKLCTFLDSSIGCIADTLDWFPQTESAVLEETM